MSETGGGYWKYTCNLRVTVSFPQVLNASAEIGNLLRYRIKWCVNFKKKRGWGGRLIFLKDQKRINNDILEWFLKIINDGNESFILGHMTSGPQLLRHLLIFKITHDVLTLRWISIFCYSNVVPVRKGQLHMLSDEIKYVKEQQSRSSIPKYIPIYSKGSVVYISAKDILAPD